MKRNKFVKPPMRSILAGIVGSVCGLTAISASAGIVGSAHDLRTFLGLTSPEICVVCHTPHDADNTTTAPLWNHTLTTATFSMYTSGGSTTIDGTEDPEPSGASKLCLSCHDGTVGLDDFGGGPNTFGVMDPASLVYVGTDLTNQHPISITYEPALDPGLNPTDTPVTIGGYTVGTTTFPTRDGDIASLLVPDGKVQCSSCHDVHNTFVATTNLLRLPMTDSTLCLTCHAK